MLFFPIIYIFIFSTSKMQIQEINQSPNHTQIKNPAQNLPFLIQMFLGKYLQSTTNLMVQITNKLLLNLHLKLSEAGLEVRGTLVHTNGEPLKIPKAFQDFFVQHSNHKLEEQNYLYSYFRNSDTFGLKRKLKVKIGQPVSSLILEETVQNLIKTIPYLVESLQFLGLKKSVRKSAYARKALELKLRKEVVKLLKQNNSTFKVAYEEKKECAVKIVNKIYEKKALLFEPSQIKRGGYFQIQKKTCVVVQDTQEKVLDLAIKRSRKKNLDQNSQEKLNYEWKIVKEIVNNSHCLTYWKTKENANEQIMVLDYVQDTLQTQMLKGLNIQKIVDFSSQIVQTVSILHQSGIIHRDLKPENFLVKKEKNQQILKVIDFGESVLKNQPFNQKELLSLGCTIPFSPLQCSLSGEQGYNKEEIDLWSIGMIFYEIVFDRIPVTYSRCFMSDIVRGWTGSDQFSVFGCVKKRGGVKMLEEVYAWIALHTLCIKQKDRLKIETIRQIIEKIKSYLHDLHLIF